MVEKKVTLIKVDGTQEVLTPGKKPELEQMQKWVGGYIEVVHVTYNGHKCAMGVNEEGKRKNLPWNSKASKLYGQTIVGDVFILEGWRL